MKKSFFSFCSTLLLIAALVGCSSSPPAPMAHPSNPKRPQSKREEAERNKSCR